MRFTVISKVYSSWDSLGRQCLEKLKTDGEFAKFPSNCCFPLQCISQKRINSAEIFCNIIINTCNTILIDSVEVGGPSSMSISFATTQISCNGFNDGAIDLIVSNGTPPFTYNWSNGNITEEYVINDICFVNGEALFYKGELFYKWDVFL